MEIIIRDDVVIDRADPMNWVLKKKTTNTRSTAKKEWRWEVLGYYGLLSNAFQAAFALCPDVTFTDNDKQLTLVDFKNIIDQWGNEVVNVASKIIKEQYDVAKNTNGAQEMESL
jgi:hypothetical protein